MKKRKTANMVFVLLLAVLFVLSGCGKYQQGQLKPADKPTNEPKQGSTEQYTEEDIQAMNDGKATIVYGDPDEDGNRYVTFINGKYYEGKVEDQEDAVESLKKIASLIGFGKGSEFFANFAERDPRGYTYWVLQQKYGENTVRYATIRVVVDPDGYVCGLSSSVVPNLGIAESSEGVGIDAAIEVVETYMDEAFPGKSYKLFEENTQGDVIAKVRTGANFHCYAIYTTNPAVQENSTFDLPYLEHIVTHSGDYVYCNPTTTMEVNEYSEAYNNDVYFENLEAATWEGDVTLYDGSKRHIKVPVARSKADGTYVLADVDRKIIVADWTEFWDNNYNLVFITSETNSGWKDYQLLELYNYGRAYDFYSELGVYGPDSFGTPMLILTDWKENGEDVQNACSYGNVKGWMAFGASAIGNCEECLDVIAHEFTHGVTGTEMAGSVYSNEQGTINESFSDIMGEICEHMTLREDGEVESDDPLWYHGQNKANPTRCASNPNAFEQPACVGDIYYIVPSSNADSTNDNGGNHFNSSLLTYVAWKLYDEGLPLEKERDLWYTTACLMTPRNDFDEVHAALLMSMEINGIDKSYADLVDETWEDLGLVGDRIKNAYSYEREGCGRIKLQIAQQGTSQVTLLTPYLKNGESSFGFTYYWMVPDDDGMIYGLLPEGEYALELTVVDYASSTMNWYYLQQNGSWTNSSNTVGSVKVKSGETVDLGTY